MTNSSLIKIIQNRGLLALVFLSILSSFIVVEAEGEQRGVPAATVITPVMETLCLNVQRCQEVDEAWRRFSQRAQFAHSGNSWDPRSEQWRESEELFEEEEEVERGESRAEPIRILIGPSSGVLPSVPSFHSLEEADSWIDAQSDNALIALFDRGGPRAATNFIVLHDGGSFSYRSLLQSWTKRNLELSYLPECQQLLEALSEGGEPTDTQKDLSKTCFRNSVSSHYHLDCDGTRRKIIEDNVIAYHAGCGSDEDNCYLPGTNEISIGIDIRNCREEAGGVYVTAAQYAELNKLLPELATRYDISINDDHVIGHFEVGKHNDPRTDFDWSQIHLTNHRQNGYCCRHSEELSCNRYVARADGDPWSCSTVS